MHYFFMFEWLIHICFTFIIFSIILKKYRWPKTSTLKSEEDIRLRLAWRIQPAWRQETHQKKIKYACYLSKLKIIISYNIYDFDWFEQVTSFVLIPTSRDNELNRCKLYCWRCWRRGRLINIFLACLKSTKLFPALDLHQYVWAKQKLLSWNLSQIHWQLVFGKKQKNNLRHISS